ncbi:MAG: hypothetical protein ABIP79_17780 [Chitinophagaceae bacterium]
MNDFILILKNEKTASYKKSILLIIGLNLIFFIYLAFAAENYKIRNAAFFAIAFILLSFAIKYIYDKRNKEFSAVFSSLGFIAFIYFSLYLWWQAIAMVVILLFYFYSIRKLQVIVSIEGIQYPSFPAKKIDWVSLNNILLKDQLITIDFKNNKLIQTEIDAEQKNVDFNEKEFNDFCRQQLNK